MTLSGNENEPPVKKSRKSNEGIADVPGANVASTEVAIKPTPGACNDLTNDPGVGNASRESKYRVSTDEHHNLNREQSQNELTLDSDGLRLGKLDDCDGSANVASEIGTENTYLDDASGIEATIERHCKPLIAGEEEIVLEDSDRRDDEDDEDEEDEDEEDVEVFEDALRAHLSTGNTLEESVRLIFSDEGDDSESGEGQTARPGVSTGSGLADPIITAFQAEPILRNDLHKVAQLCAAMYKLAEEGVYDVFLSNSRPRLDLSITSLQDVVKLIDQSKNIVVLSGAGVSVSCGIPDFRSKGGMYDRVLERFGLSDPQAIFDLGEFKNDPTLFYSFAKEIIPSPTLRPSLTHFFVAELDRRGKLLRNYSQNIDGLESRAGIAAERVVLCHGSFLSATCMRRTCRKQIAGSEIIDDVLSGRVPLCPSCHIPDLSKKDESDEEDDDFEPGGEQSSVLKPDIVFFGENLPRAVEENLRQDVYAADLIMVLGTSLQVAPVARIPQQFADSVPQILVNRELVGSGFDVELLGDCDVVVNEISGTLNWKLPICDGDGSAHANAPSQGGVSEVKVVEDKGTERAAVPGDEKVCDCPGESNIVCKMVKDNLSANPTATATYEFLPPRRFIFPGANSPEHVVL